MVSEPFIGEVSTFGFKFAPENWAKCDGALLSIDNYPALFAIIGATYGGQGHSSFRLPQLQGRVPIGPSDDLGYLGIYGGTEYAKLYLNNLGSHRHDCYASSEIGDSVANRGGGNQLATENITPIYSKAQDKAALAEQTVTTAGGGEPHYNVQPYLSVLFCIALHGAFPQSY